MKPKRPSVRNLPAPDDVSISESICSGVLDEDQSGGGSESGAFEMSDHSLRDSFGSKSGGFPPTYATAVVARHEARSSMLHRNASEGNAVTHGRRKDRAKEKPAGSRLDGRKLKKSYRSLGQRMDETAERLEEWDPRAVSKIESLQSELKATDRGAVRGRDQSGAIRTLGRKLIQQAAVIKKQKEVAVQYKMRLGAMEEEMAMQDERDSQREEEYAELQERYDGLNEQKVNMENLLQENIKEIADLKSQAERHAKKITTSMRMGAMEEEMAMQDERDAQREEEYAKLQDRYDSVNEQKVKMENLLQQNVEEMAYIKSRAEKDVKTIMELELKLRQKDATLDGVLKEGSDEPRKIDEIKDELEGKSSQVDIMREKLEVERLSVENMKKDYESANNEMGGLPREHALRKTVRGTIGEEGGGGESDARRQPIFESWIRWVVEVTGLKILELEIKLKQKEATLDRVTKERSDKSLKIAGLEDELEEKNSQVDSMMEKMKEGRLLMENIKKDFKSTNAENEELRRELSRRKVAESTAVGGRGGDEGHARRQPVFMSWIQGMGEVTHLKTLELELKMKQKEAKLERVIKDGIEKSLKIAELKDKLEEKNSQADNMRGKLKGGRLSLESMKKDLESAKTEIEELRRGYSSRKTAEGISVKNGGGDEGNARRQSVFSSWIQGVSEKTGLKILELERKLKQKEATLDKVTKEGSDKSLKIAELEDELQEKNNHVESMGGELEERRVSMESMKKDLESANAKHNENIKTLRSELVKMSSTYKQDSYLKRKEIVELKQKNAEGALKRRGLEKALKSVNSTQKWGRAAVSNFRQPKMQRRRSRSMDMEDSRDEASTALQAHMEGLALYEFPPLDRLNLLDSKLVMESTFTSTLNIFDEDDEGSEEGRKGELPEEC